MKNHCENGSVRASVLKPKAKRYTNWYIALNGFLPLYLCRYDFSEPQFGKYVCDRIISPLKSALRRYCNEGNDIWSASDMHRALEARKAKGTTVAVSEIDSTKAAITADRMAGFSSYHNFSHQPEGIVVSCACGIGSGKLIKWNTLNIKCKSLSTAKDSESNKGFSSVTPRRMTLPTVQEEEADVVNDVSYQCNEPGCSYVSANFEALRDHVNVGRHELSKRDNE